MRVSRKIIFLPEQNRRRGEVRKIGEELGDEANKERKLHALVKTKVKKRVYIRLWCAVQLARNFRVTVGYIMHT